MCQHLYLSVWIAVLVTLSMTSSFVEKNRPLYSRGPLQRQGLQGAHVDAVAKEGYSNRGDVPADIRDSQDKKRVLWEETSAATVADCQGQDQTTLWTFIAPWTNLSAPLVINSTVDLRCFYMDCNPSQTVVVQNTRKDIISSSERTPAKSNRRYRQAQMVVQSCRDMGLYRCLVSGSDRGLDLTLLVQCPPELNSRPTAVTAIGGRAEVSFSVRSPTSNFTTCLLIFASQPINCASHRSHLTVDGNPPNLRLQLTLYHVTQAERGNWTLAIANGFTGSSPTTATATFVVKVAGGPPEFNSSPTAVTATGGKAEVSFSVRSPTSNFTTCLLIFASQPINCASHRSHLRVDGNPPNLSLQLTLYKITQADTGTWTLAIANGFRGSSPTTATATFVVKVAEESTKPANGSFADKEGVSPPVKEYKGGEFSMHWIIIIGAPVCAALVVIVAAVSGAILYRRSGRRREKRQYLRVRGPSLQDEIYYDIDATPSDNPVEGVVSATTPLLQLTDLSSHSCCPVTSLSSLKTFADQPSERWSTFPSEVTDMKQAVLPVRTAGKTPGDQHRSRCTNVYQTSLSGTDASKPTDTLPSSKGKTTHDSASTVPGFEAPRVKKGRQKVKDSRDSSVLAVARPEDKNLDEIYNNEGVDIQVSTSATSGSGEPGDLYEIDDGPDSRSSGDTEGYYSNESSCPSDHNQWDRMEDVYENMEAPTAYHNSSSLLDDVYGNLPQGPGDFDNYEVPVTPPKASSSFARPDLEPDRAQNSDACRMSDARRERPKGGVSLDPQPAGNLACRPLPARNAPRAGRKSEAVAVVLCNEEGYIPMNPFP